MRWKSCQARVQQIRGHLIASLELHPKIVTVGASKDTPIVDRQNELKAELSLFLPKLFSLTHLTTDVQADAEVSLEG